MLSSKLLSASRSLVRANALNLKNTGGVVKRCYVVATPPQVKVSMGEMIFSGLFLAVSMWGYPLWVLYYIPDYQGEDRNKYTGK